MYTPRALFPRLILKICFFVLSLYTVGRLVTLPYEISSNLHHYRLETKGKVRSAYIHAVNRIMRCCIYGRLKFSKMAAGRHLEFDPTGNGAVRSAVPENPALEPNMRGIGWRVAELWPFEIFPKCVNGPWGRSSVVGRSSIFILLTQISYTHIAT